MIDNEVELPAPNLTPRLITLDEYHAHAPEKVELIEGFVFTPPEYGAGRECLRLLLVNLGLLEAVRLAPEASWREALRQVYGSSA